MITRIFNQKYKLLAFGSILLLGTLIYSNTFYSSFHLDDGTSIVDNPVIKNILDLKAIWGFWPTRFITYLSVALNYSLSQLNVLSYHIFNLIVHLSAAMLVWWFMLLAFSTPVMKAQKITKHANLIALFTGLVFVAHPIQTQGVTYIIQRAASLTTFFYLASLSLYVKSRLLQQQGESSISQRLFYWSALIAAVMAMFTKEMAVTLPLMVLLHELCFMKTKERLNWKQLIPFFGIALIIPLTMSMTKSVDLVGMRRVIEEPFNISPRQYLLTQFRVIVTYIRLLFIPINQNLDYYYPVAKSLLELPILASLILLASILTMAIRIFSKYRLISFGIFWFFLTLLPESSVIPIRDVIFEHRLYLPMVGFSIFLVSLIYYLFENKAIKSMVIALLIITSSYAVLAYRRNFIWKDELTLWNDAVHRSPEKERPYNNRGLAYKKQGNIQSAFSDYDKAIAINPKYAEAYNNRGIVYKDQENIQQAMSDYNKAIEINPNLTEAYNNRGTTYYQQGNFMQAFSDYDKAIAIKPNYAEAYYNRGIVYKDQGNIQQAMSDYNKAIEINPNLTEAYNNRGLAYKDQGNFTQAISELTKAIKINPNYKEAYNNRGLAYKDQGNFTQAISDLTKIIEINPNYSEAYYNRGVIYDSQGNVTQAISDFTRAIEINSNYAEAYYNRGTAYAKQGNSAQAISDFTRAIEIYPNYAEAYYNRGIAFYGMKEYDNAWRDVHKAEALGYAAIHPGFLAALKKASGREK